ncbi:hypothetical protein CMV_027010 [Castanea mollissima]|uniref:Uncharacterized protein n=1 Tax=Castanea mollissima TaxID=60419 RepID=A0A8J4Q746_9ROSI|nr:hypothetical protein CMV_027010 [Castanea mollissima]
MVPTIFLGTAFAITSSIRHFPPTHFLLKIESYATMLYRPRLCWKSMSPAFLNLAVINGGLIIRGCAGKEAVSYSYQKGKG